MVKSAHVVQALLSSLLFTACAMEDSSDDASSDEQATPVTVGSVGEPRPVIMPEPTPAVDEAPVEENPITDIQFFGQNGNLYKPRGDDHGAGGGNLVVLLSSQYTVEFERCEIRLRSGQVAQLRCINDQPWTQIPYSCFSNGNRQTWRADFKCSDVAEVSVTCREEKQEIVFTVPERQRGQVCSRFG